MRRVSQNGLWKCNKCYELKPRESFHQCKNNGASGIHSCCKECRKSEYEIGSKARADILRKHKFGVTRDQYAVMLERQNHVCAICEEVCNSGRRLAVDHNHTTGQIRDLLCGRCNTALGQARESTDILYAMIKYLEKWA